MKTGDDYDFEQEVMFATLSRQIAELKRQVDENRRQVEGLTRCLCPVQEGESYGNDVGGEEGEKGGGQIWPSLQAQIKQNSFRINSLQAQVREHTTLLTNLALCPSPRQQTVYACDNDHLDGVQTATGLATSAAVTTSADISDAAHHWSVGVTSELTPFLPHSAIDCNGEVGSNNHSYVPPLQLQWLTEQGGAHGLKPHTPDEPHQPPPIDQDEAGEDGNEACKPSQLPQLKKRLKELETQVHNKDRVIRDLVSGQEDLTRREKELLQKQDWQEHKMRLLKQDKRRRGETIGKLLRCIDDLRESGRLEEGRVAESGRAVLNATLTTRGLPQEERVKAAVNASDLDRGCRVRLSTPQGNISRSVTPSPRDDLTGDDSMTSQDTGSMSIGQPMFPWQYSGRSLSQ